MGVRGVTFLEGSEAAEFNIQKQKILDEESKSE
jgi:hypothetical protein